MADPATLMLIAAGVGAATQVAGGFAERGAAMYNAEIAEQNARLSTQRAEARAGESARQNRLAQSMRIASAAGRGVQFSGSALDAAAQEAVEADLESRFIIHAGEVKSLGFRQEAKQQRRAGNFAAVASVGQAAGTLLSGLSAAGGMSPGATGTAGGGGAAKSAGKVAKGP